jgi:ubiquinone/menaquinone biosynthesis C-methylase UbiE
MDDPDLNPKVLEAVLKDVNQANTLLGGYGITLRAIVRLAAKHPKREYIIVDMGCGDGQMLRKVSEFCAKKKISVRLHGLDLNEESIKIAREKSRAYGNISFEQKDILKIKSDDFPCDLILCTLTLHHFGDKEIHTFIKKFAELSRIGVIINDLDRNKIACLLFRIFALVFVKTEIARNDGLISIRRGFTKKELLGFSKVLPDMHHSINWRWAFRYEWTFTHPKSKLL